MTRVSGRGRLARLFRQPYLHLTAAALLAMAATGCATAAPYNPDHLATDRLSLVRSICQTVMGLNPNEPLVSGVWLDAPHLDTVTNRYSACIVSLSDSSQKLATGEAAQQAQATCADQGLAPGSAAFAICTLRDMKSNNGRTATASDVAETVPISQVAARGAFIYAFPHEALRRERFACASLGLAPPGGLFDGCVAELTHYIDAIDNPID